MWRLFRKSPLSQNWQTCRDIIIGYKLKKLRIYFNNHYLGAAIINALQFEQMLGNELSKEKEKVLQHAEKFYAEHRPPKNHIA